MDFRVYSFRYGEEIAVSRGDIVEDWYSIKSALKSITEQDIIDAFIADSRISKSLAHVINNLIRERLERDNWRSESPIFQEEEYLSDRRWRLDFSRNSVAVEVAFNHREAIAWNLIKPVISSELNHVRKAVQTSIGIIITATEELRQIGGFDGAVGTYETHLTYLKPLRNILTVPMIILGLEAPESFKVSHEDFNGRKKGIIESKVSIF